MQWKLMTDRAITDWDRWRLSQFISNSPKLTQGNFVKQFEKEWSEWLGCKYSVFVNSGSSANLMIVRALSDNQKHKWISQACTWSTAVSPILQHGDLQLCDVDLTNFGPDLKNLEHIFETQKPKFMFLTHLLGFCAITQELLDLCEKHEVQIIEDCCESHGAKFGDKKVGTNGVASSFSFYYGHHMTTIEGGMVCTNDESLYHELLLLRSHGLLRELPPEEQDKRRSDNVDPLFTFVRDGYNLRSTDLHAFLGTIQLPGLDECIKKRNENYNTFINNLDSSLYRTDYKSDGCSNFALPIFTKRNNIEQIKTILRENDIEYRPCIAGNLYEHPFMQQVEQETFDDNVKQIHRNCIYVGNHKDVKEDMVIELCEILNSLGDDSEHE